MSFGRLAIIQARMGSSRLPGKVLADIAGEPMLDRVVHRVGQAATVDAVVLATSTDTADDTIADHCRAVGIACMRGSHFDVLDRYHEAALAFQGQLIIRITADCPLIDPDLIDQAVHVLTSRARGETVGSEPKHGALDFVANRLPPPWHRTYPIGLDVEVCTIEALDRAWREARETTEREHVMPFLYAGVVLERESPQFRIGLSPQGFRIGVLDHTEDLGHYRWTVDTAADLDFAREVYHALEERPHFRWLDVVELVRARPELLEINAGVHHKSLGEIDERTVDARGE